MEKKICKDCKWYGGKKVPKCVKNNQYVARKNTCENWERRKK